MKLKEKHCYITEYATKSKAILYIREVAAFCGIISFIQFLVIKSLDRKQRSLLFLKCTRHILGKGIWNHGISPTNVNGFPLHALFS